MSSLSASIGDVIEIRGKRRTVAKCLPLYSSDEGKGIIRIDGLIRNNAGVGIGDTITAERIKSAPAEKVIVEPLEPIPPIDDRYLAYALESVPLIRGDKVMIPLFGSRLTFHVIDVTPSTDNQQSIMVTPNTTFQIVDNKEYPISKPVEGITQSSGAESGPNIKRDESEDVDLFSKLERFAGLKQKGILTDQEFEKVKLQILAKILPEAVDQSVIKTGTKSDSNYDTEQDASDRFLVYENLKYGIRLRYPSICEGLELDKSTDEGVVTIAQFIWKGGSTVVVRTSVIPYGSKSLEVYSRSRLFRLRKILPQFEIIESGPITLAGSNGHKIVYIYSNNRYKIMEVWTVRNKNAYTISYSALTKEQFDNNLMIAQNMIESFEITANEIVDDTDETTSDSDLLLYTSDDFSIQYPKDWIVDERNYPGEKNEGNQIVAFMSPSIGKAQVIEERLVISSEKIDPRSRSLDEFTNDYIVKIANQLQNLNFVLLELAFFNISNVPAKQVIYSTSSSLVHGSLQTMEILAIKEDRLYTITFGVRLQEFSNYLPTIEKMLDSFVIHTQEPEETVSNVTVHAPRIPFNRVSELSVLLELANKNINRGNEQIISISVADKYSHVPVSVATIKGEVFSPSSKYISLEEQITDQNGKAAYSWSIDDSVETGEFTVVIRISANDYEPKSVSDTYKVNSKNTGPV